MRRLFVLVAAVVFLDTSFYAAISPLLPHYADDLDLSKSAAGILSASYAAGTLLAALPSGWLAARVGVKPTVLTGLGLLGGSSLAFGLAQDVVVLDVARFAQGVGGACSWAGGMAWLLAAAPRERRGEMIGSALGVAIAGVLFGPVVGGAATVAGPEAVFSCVAVLAGVLAFAASGTPGAPRSPLPSWATLGAALRRREVVAGVWLMTLPALFTGVLNVLGPLRLSHLGASGVAVGAVWLVAAGVEAALSPLVGRVSDRRGRFIPIRWGIGGACLMCVLIPLPGDVLVLAVLIVATAAVFAAFWAPAMALLSDAADAAGLDQGLGFALTNLAWAGGQVVGGSVGARLGQSVGDAVPYAACAALCAVTFVALTAARRPASAASRISG
jgi:MFS family permease